MIRDDDVFINLRNPINIIEHPPEYRLLTDFQQRLRKVLRQLPQSRRISRRYYNIFHNDDIFGYKDT